MEEALTQTFAAPMGKSTFQMTVFTSVILLFVAGLQIILGLRRDSTVRILLVGAGSFILVCLAASLLLKVRGYEVTPSQVVAKFGFSSREFPISEIESVTLQPNALRGSRRDMGNGGLWSFLGSFSSPELGKIRAYVSDTRKTVVMKMPEYAVVMSPGDPAAFIAAVEERRKGALE